VGDRRSDQCAGVPRRQLYLLYRDRTLSVRDVLTGDELKSIDVRLDGDTPRSLAVSPDGRSIIVAGSDSLTLVDVKSGKARWALKGVSYPFAVSPDGRNIVAMSKNDVKVILLTSGATVRSLPMCGPWAFTPDGKRLLVSLSPNASMLALCDPATGKKLRSFDLGGDCVTVAFSPDGRLLVAGNMYNTATLWDTYTGGKIASYNGHELGSVYPISGVAFTRDGRTMAIGFYEGDIRQFRLQ
jgi:WD40 repeat protein